MFAAGLWLALSVTRARDRIGRWGFAGLAALLLLIYAANVTSPPPPSIEAVGWVGVIGALAAPGPGRLGRPAPGPAPSPETSPPC